MSGVAFPSMTFGSALAMGPKGAPKFFFLPKAPKFQCECGQAESGDGDWIKWTTEKEVSLVDLPWEHGACLYPIWPDGLIT